MKTGTDGGEAEQSEATFRIGAVARLTQIPVDTLRVWERRYKVVSPKRAANSARLYDEHDIERLRLIKQLVAAGHAISTVAGLERDKLQQLVARHSNARAAAPTRIGTVAMYAETCHVMSETEAHLASLTETGRFDSWVDFRNNVAQAVPDAIVVELAALTAERTEDLLTIAAAEAAMRCIVVYGFAPGSLVSRLRNHGLVVLQAPVDANQVLSQMQRETAPSKQFETDADEIPPRLMSDTMLDAIGNASTNVACECPGHIVDIIRTLLRFEIYSADCENRNADDAALHLALRKVTANARRQFEVAALEIAEHEQMLGVTGLLESTQR